MERFDLSADEAFERLWRMSQNDPTKALEVAAAVVNSMGQLDGPGGV